MNEVFDYTIAEKQTSKYIKKDSDKSVFKKVSIFYLLTYILLPQYFGFEVAGFDLSLQRIGMLLVLFYVLESTVRTKSMFLIIKESSILPVLLLYFFVLIYTMIFRKNINTFMYTFIEFLCFFSLIYLFRNGLSLNEFVSSITVIAYVFGIQGLIEYITRKSLFSYLETIQGLYTGGMIRSGAYRVMGPSNHSLGYGLVLITIIPLICINYEEDKIDILKNKPLLIILMLNVFLTGSRSTLAVFLLEIGLLFLFSDLAKKKRALLGIFAFVFFLAIFVVLTYKTGFSRYIMLQITSVIDEIFKTHFAINFGADITTLSNSSDYRKVLPEVFKLPWLNPLIGRGSSYSLNAYISGHYIRSVDNFYVAQYIRFAYPGLVTYILIMLFVAFRMIKYAIKFKSGIVLGIFIGIVCYYVNLWWLDTLQTIKYVYILFAVYFAFFDIKLKIGGRSEV